MRQLYIVVMMSAVVLLPVKARSLTADASGAGAAARSPQKAAFERGYRLKERKQDAQALAVFNAILQKDPGNHAALTEAGYLHANLKHYASAAKLLSAASVQDPENMRLRMDLGYARQALKQYEEANEQFLIVGSKPGEFQITAQAAAAEVERLRSAGNPAEAERRRGLERGYAALNRGEKEAARETFAALVARDPSDEAARKQLGFIHFDEGKLAEAAEDFEAVRALKPNDHLVALQLGYTYDRLKKKEQARAAFTDALGSADPRIQDAARTALRASGAPETSVPATSL